MVAESSFKAASFRHILCKKKQAARDALFYMLAYDALLSQSRTGSDVSLLHKSDKSESMGSFSKKG